MTDEKKTNELKDEELEKVTGGGSGTVPTGGITFTISGSVKSGHYYSKYMDLTNVVYVYQGILGQEYNNEKFVVDEATGCWSSNKVGSFFYVGPNFLNEYPYILNVRP